MLPILPGLLGLGSRCGILRADVRSMSTVGHERHGVPGLPSHRDRLPRHQRQGRRRPGRRGAVCPSTSDNEAGEARSYRRIGERTRISIVPSSTISTGRSKIRVSRGSKARGLPMSQPKAKKGSGTRAGSTRTHTSSSASASKKTSSRSGTSIPTADTAKSKEFHEIVENGINSNYMMVASKIDKMSGSDFRASLVRAGIISTKGTLKAKYKKK